MKLKTKILYLFLLLFNFKNLSAQNSFDSSHIKAEEVYKKTIGVNTHLYNGSEYIDYDHRVTGNPFFGGVYFTSGSIVFDGIYYTDVQLFYDVLNDDVVIKNYTDTPLILNKEKISSFDIAGHHFIKVFADSATEEVKSGFYDVLYDGKTKLFSKRKKVMIEKIDAQYSESFFSVKDEYYILKNDVFYPVDDKHSALSVMKDKKKDLSKFAHQNKLNFKKNRETSLVKLVAYYDSLKIPK